MQSTISFGDTGFQAGVINGQVNTEFHYHAPTERSETLPNPSIVIPFSRDKDFVERGTILDQIHQKCVIPGSRTALVGIGGVGKSQLAIEYAYRTRDRSPETWVFWVYASNPARFEQSFRDIANCVKIFGRHNPQTNIFQLVHDWLHSDRKEKWVLILDNIDDAGFLLKAQSTGQDRHTNSRGTEKIRPLMEYLPRCPNGSILITTRSKSAAQKVVEQRDIITVELMDRADGLALFERKLGWHDDSEDVVELVTVLEFMPLAIVQAAAYISQKVPRYSVRQYIQDFRRSDRKRTSLLNWDGGELREAKKSIITTWQISFDYIRKIRPSAANLLSLMSFFDRQGIPEALLRSQDEQRNSPHDWKEDKNTDINAGYGDNDEDNRSQSNVDGGFEDDVLALRNYLFISVNMDGTFDIHRLVQLATREWLKASNQQERWKEQFIKNLCAQLPTGEYENWVKYQTFFPHVQSAIAQQPEAQDSLRDWASILYKAAWYAWRMGKGVEAEKMSVQAMKVRKRILGQEHSDTLDSMAMVGLVYQLRSKYDAAEPLYRETLQLRETVLGKKHPDTLASMNNLAGLLVSQGKYDEADPLYRETLQLREKVLGKEHPQTLESMNNLASLLESQGNYDMAEPLCQETLQLSEKVLGKEHPQTLRSMNNLVGLLESQSKYDAAKSLCLETLQLSEKVLGKKHPDTLASMKNLAGLLEIQGKYDVAELLYWETLQLREKVLGKEHPQTLESMNNLAGLLESQGKYNAAELLCQEMLQLTEQVLGKKHPDTLTSMNNLAGLLKSQGKYDAAEPLYQETLQLREQVLGKEHPDTLSSMNNLAFLLKSQGKYDAAEPLYQEMLQLLKKVFGKEHPQTLRSMNNLAGLLESQGEYNAAELLYRETLQLTEQIFGACHPDTLTSMTNLASMFSNQGRWEATEELFMQVMETNKKILGTDHPDTLISMVNLASTFWSQGRWEAAEKLEVQVMETRKKQLGIDHPDTLTSMANLASTFWNQGRWDAARELFTQVMETSKKILGADHPDTLTSMANLALTFSNQGQWEAAEELFMQVMETNKRVLGVEHPSTLSSIANLASTFWSQGRWEAAEELEVQVMETRKKQLGTDHPDTLTSMANLASTFWNQGRWDAAKELFTQVMETSKKIFGVNHPDTLTSMANLALTFSDQGQWEAAEKLFMQVIETRKKILGVDRSSMLASIDNLALTYRNQRQQKKAEELDEAGTTFTGPRSAFWSDRAYSTNPSSLSQVPVDIEQVINSHSPMTFYRHKPSANELKLDKRDGDIQSIKSIPGDIDSLVESISEIMHYRQAIVNYIVKIFTDDLELLALYQDAIHRMGEAKFVKNNRRLLKRLFLDLRDEGYSASQKLAVRFLRSRSKRTHISSEIRRLLMPSDYTVREKINLMLKQEPGNLSLLDRFLNDKDSVTQEASTVVATGSLLQPWVRDEQSEESEDDENYEDLSSNESETELEDIGILTKLAATADFLISGKPFRLYKENLRAFIQPVYLAADLEENFRSNILAGRKKESELLNLDYDIMFPRGFISSLQDMCKIAIEYLAGCQLSWWPLAEPEDPLRPDHIRIYSMPFRGRRFYDDIPIPLAELLFPKLPDNRTFLSEYSRQFLGREAILLHNTTLMRLLLIHFTSKANIDTTEQDMFGIPGHTRSDTQPTYGSSSQHSKASQVTERTSTMSQKSLHTSRSNKKSKKNTSHNKDIQENPVLFLSVYTGLNESIARTIVPGTTDEATFQCLWEAYRSISSGWFRLKRATGIKFFRFHSFLFKETSNFHYVDIHHDKERYPEVSDPEFEDYRYMPRPWPLETPYPSHEVWHYFNHPEDCGTSKDLKEMLPTRFKGPIAPRSRAFGVHIEERYSFLAIFIPASLIFLLTLGATIWFIPSWLMEHPGDLQNAIVPVILAFTVVGHFIQLVVSLLIFRWTIIDQN